MRVFQIKTFSRAISSHKTPLMVFGVTRKSCRLATKRFHKITRKLDFCLYFNFSSLFFASIIAEVITKREKAITIT